MTTAAPTHAISLWNPWAWLCVQPSKHHEGRPMKDVENRPWATKRRGRVFIHAGLSREDLVVDQFAWINERLDTWDLEAFGDIANATPKAAFGAIIGEVEIVDCIEAAANPWFENRWLMGPFAFILRNPIAYPVTHPCRGYQGFFTVKDPGALAMAGLIHKEGRYP